MHFISNEIQEVEKEKGVLNNDEKNMLNASFKNPLSIKRR